MQSIISKLKAEGVLVVYHDYRNGTTKDLSGNGLDGTIVGTPAFNHNGLDLKSAADYVQIASDARTHVINGSIICYFDKQRSQIPYYIAAYNVLGAPNDIRYIHYTALVGGADTFSLNNGSSEITLAHTLNNKCIAVNLTNAGAAQFFADGVLVGTTVSSLTIGGTANDLKNYSASGALLLFSRRLTATEHAQVFAELENLKFNTKTLARSTAHPNVNKNGLVCEYLITEGAVQGGKVRDSSGNGYDATIYGSVNVVNTEVGKAIEFKADHSSFIISSQPGVASSTPWSMEFVCKWFGGGGTYVAYAESGGPTGIFLKFVNSALSFRRESAPYTYANLYNTPINQWFYCVFSADDRNYLSLYVNGVLVYGPFNWTDTALSVPNRIGGYGDYANLQVALHRFYNRQLSASEVANSFAPWKSALAQSAGGAIQSMASEGGVIGGYLSNTPWQFGDTTGRFTVTTATIKGKTNKIINTSTPGFLYLDMARFNQTPTEATYGEWTFYLSNSGAGANSLVQIGTTKGRYDNSVSGNNGYIVYLNAVGIYVGFFTEGVFRGNLFGMTPYTSYNTFYRIKVVRTTAGVFSIYVNDTLVPVTIGTNPFTENTCTLLGYIIYNGGDVNYKIAYDEGLFTKTLLV